jgi:hypothetical protein
MYIVQYLYEVIHFFIFLVCTVQYGNTVQYIFSWNEDPIYALETAINYADIKYVE